MAHVLIADDEPLFVEGLEMFLQAEGYSVQTAQSAEEALRAFSARAPDVFITDFSLGEGTNGTELARRFQETNANLHVIVISGYSEATIRADAEGIDHLHVFTKPLRFQPLRDCLMECAKSH